MTGIALYIILIGFIIFAFIILFIISELKLEIKQLKHDIRSLEEEHGIFKNSEK